MVIQIKKAVKFGAKLRLALYGPSGSGKTYTALSIAREMVGDKRVCVIDTERGSASKYADIFDFDVVELDSFHPNGYIEAIRAVIQAGEYGVLVIDSASHEWEGSRGALELAGRDFTNWATVTPLHNKFVDAMLAADVHIIVTMRAKEEHVMEKEEGKKAVIRKVGMEPVQRKGIQYEFDIVGMLSMENTFSIEKTRCSALKDQNFAPGHEKNFVEVVRAWLDGAPAPEKPLHLAQVEANGTASSDKPSEQQLASIRKLCEHLGKPEPSAEDVDGMTYARAKELIAQFSQEYRQMRTNNPQDDQADPTANAPRTLQTSHQEAQLTWSAIYQVGAARGVWTKEDFYAKASASLNGFPVNANNVKALSQEQLQKLQRDVERYQPEQKAS